MTGITVVIATRNRRDRLAGCLARLTELPERPPVIVVDNGSADGTADMVRRDFAGVSVIRLPRNLGAPARNLGVRAAATPLVAFCDDDSEWAPGALARAETVFAAHPRLALAAASIVVGPAGRPDPVCARMAAAPLGISPDLPGPTVTGFLAFAAVVRREPFLATGGFDDVVFFLGEEERVAYDLLRVDWGLAYCPEIRAIHHPAGAASGHREVLAARNHALTCWMRRPLAVALDATAAFHRQARSAGTGGEIRQFLRRLPSALVQRVPASAQVESMFSRCDGCADGSV